MRVLITGAHGQVGHELMRLLPDGFEAVGMGSAQLDIADAVKVAEVVAAVQPQLFINAAAYTAVDKAENEPQRAWAVNRDGVAHLAHAAERLNIPLLHLSTDYVFAGDAREPYRETDPTGPTGVYGASKLGGEVALAEHCRQHLILRTSWVFGAHGNNFVKTMLRLGRERDELGVVADQHGCPTSAASIASALWSLASQYLEHGELQWGVYHFSGAPACTWHGFALEIFRQAYAQGSVTQVPLVRAIGSVEFPAPVRRPAWSVLDCAKLQGVHGIALPDWREDLEVVLGELLVG